MITSFYTLSANEQVLLALIIALILSEGLNENQLNILGNFVEAVGQNILLLQAVISAVPNNNERSDCDICAELNSIRIRLDTLESKIQKQAFGLLLYFISLSYSTARER